MGWTVLDQIIGLLNANLVRVENLNSRYGPARPGRRTVDETDILRAALVLLHASMEEFLRSLLIWRAPHQGKDVIDAYPLAGTGKKNPDKFTLGALHVHREKTVSELNTLSVTEYLEAFQSFNDLGEVKKALKACGIAAQAVEGHDFGSLPAMIERRHNIVHRADRNNVAQGQGNHRAKPIELKYVRSYVDAVKSLRDFAQAQLEGQADQP